MIHKKTFDTIRKVGWKYLIASNNFYDAQLEARKLIEALMRVHHIIPDYKLKSDIQYKSYFRALEHIETLLDENNIRHLRDNMRFEYA